MNGKAWRVALAVFVLGALARLALGVVVSEWETARAIAGAPDAYPQLARSLVERGTLGYGPLGAEPTTARGPACPAWLAAGMLVLGDGPVRLRLWSALPGLVGGALLAWLLARRHGTRAALVGGLLAVAHPLPALAALRLMSDELYAVLGLAAAACWVASNESRRGALTAAGGGLLLGAHVLTRASGLLSAVALAACGPWRDRRRVRRQALVLAVALLAAAAWSVRSSRLAGAPVVVHSLAGYNFWFGEAMWRLGAGRAPGETRRLAMELIARHGEYPRAAEPDFWYVELEPRTLARVERRLVRAALRHVAAHPVDYASRVATGVGRFWIAGDDPARSRQYALLVLPLLALAALGLPAVLGRRAPPDPLARCLAAMLVLHALAYAAIWPAARMSVQVYPALCYLAALGADRTLARLPWPRRS